MKIVDLIHVLPKGSTYYSFEYFPPKTTVGLENLMSRITRMSNNMLPLFSSVTWGTAGSTANVSVLLSKLLENQHKVPACLHLTCTNVDRKVIDEALETAKNAGIRNILALRGDPPLNGDHWEGKLSDFEHAVDLVRYIRQKYGDYFCIGVAAYPEGHADSNVPELTRDPVHDIPFLVEKVKAGADFIMTQIFYEPNVFIEFEKTLRNHESGVFRDITIIPAVMPIQSFSILKRMTRLCGCSIPESLMKRLEAVKSDDEAVKSIGVEHAVEMINIILQNTDHRVLGFHFCTLNLEKSVARILKNSSLLTHRWEQYESQLKDDKTLKSTRRRLSLEETPELHNHVVIPPDDSLKGISASLRNQPNEAALATHRDSLTADAPFSVSEGSGVLGRQANWDDFPNGRFGDPRSPAYGEIDGYGPTLHFPQQEALRLWGYPVDESDITSLFQRHIKNDIHAIPWIDETVDDETKLISQHLLNVNGRTWWTVGSQPTVNGAPSTDPVFGWGPKGGKVYQKAFIEFFISSKDFESFVKKWHDNEQITYYAGNKKGDFLTNAPNDGASAVTWGVYPGREIIQSTIIAEVSFKAWMNEAFDVWAEWAYLYPKNTATRNLLDHCTNDRWLVSVIHHDYMDNDGLWKALEVA
ncbi:methylenetetrahydrofolate reductase Met11 [Schizosaccharomyces osmophilus]|uniref:Methylenetetrahydrofolate reductase Met11 n=1 Tax=Schizosaccharomyces osmophilus TaxID=2545709 RepID=A0AAF0AUH6_9SCHI|nr:methylenetetrahydrofolate reductase Met11 [Schizosaccharomyces osmophilus]WBW70864.1 methylenetetrahydrofolate reductase Met11 [Schizosaccharomyces osmophilus]